MANINAQFNYSANFGPVIGQMQKLTAEANILNNTLQNLDKQSVGLKSNLAGAFASDIGKIGGWNAKMVELTDSVDQFGQSLLKQKLTLKQYAQEAIGAFSKSSNAHKLAVREVSREMSQLVNLGKGMDGKQMGMMITPATINLKDFNTQLAVSQKQWSIFNNLVQDGTTHLINFGKNTQWAGRQITVGLTVPLTIYGNTVSKIFREVDAELTRFKKVYGSDLGSTSAEVTERMVNDVRNVAIEFAKSFGIAAKETASLAADLAATGLEGQKLLASLRETTRLAVLGDVSNQDAMKTTLSLQNAFKISTDDLASSVNFLNAVENQTSLSLQDLTTAIPKAGPVVKSLGGDVKDLALLMVALKEGGISAAEGANALKSGMASLINPTKQASLTAKQYGIDIEGIVQANRGQLMPTIIAFQQQLQLLDEFGKAQVIENVFGKYQFARLSALFDNLNASASQTNAVLGLMGKSSKELAATAYQEMDTLMNSSSKRFQRAIEGIKAQFISIGGSITSAVTPILENLTGKIQKAIEFFQNLPKPVKSFIKVATGLTAIAGPIIMMVGIFSNFLGYIGKGAMGMVNLGRRMAGIPVQKFEMLTDTQIMAQKATDQLAQSFDREKSSVERLNQALGIYRQNLVDAINLNPAFVNRQMPSITPTTPTAQLQKGGRLPGYANNSSAWVPGSGDGDKVPAMLEPGEYVVNKKAAAKYSGTLDQINYQSAPRFQKGGRMPGYADTSTSFNYDATYPGDGFKLDQSKHLVLANGKVMLKADYDRISSQGGRLPVLMRDDMNPYLNEKYEPSLRYRLGNENPFVGPLPQVSYQAMGRAGVGGSRNVYGYPFKSEQEAGVFSTLNSTTFGANQGGSKTSNISRSINDPQQQAYADWIAGHNTNQFRAGTGVMKRLQMEGHRDQMLRSMGPISQSIPLFRGTVLKEKGANEFSGVGARELLMYIKHGMFDKAMGKKIQWSDMQSFSTIPDIANYSKFIESWTNPSNTNSKKAADRQLASMEMLPVIFRLASAKGQTGFNISSKAMVQEVMGSPVDEKEWVLNNPSGTISGIRQDMGTKHHIIDLMQKGGRVQSHAEESKDLSEAFETYKIGQGGNNASSTFELVRDYGEGMGASVKLKESQFVNQGWLIDTAYSHGAPQTAIVELMIQARKMVQEQGGDLSISAIKNEGSYSTFSAPMLLAAERMGLISFSEEEKLALSGKNEYSMQDFLDGKDPDAGISTNTSNKETAEQAITADLRFIKGFKRNKNTTGATLEKIDALPNWKKEFLNQKGIPLFKQIGGRIQSHADESLMPEKYSKKMENIQSIMDATSQEATGGMYAGMPMTDIGNLVDRIGGRSAAIPGASGIYEQGGVRSVVKGHNTATSARIEAIASALTRSVFGLESPVQEFIKFAHPETSSAMFGVRSPFDAKFAKTSGKISPDKFFMQALSAIIRGDSDLQPDNLYDGIVVDQGAGYGSDRASQPRGLTGKKFSVGDQAKVNFLMQKGGARRWFTEATAGIAQGMTREQYIAGFMQAISTAQANFPAAMASLAGMNLTKEEQQIFGVLAGDLQAAQGIDWGSVYDSHIGVTPEVKKPPTEAAAAKALLTKQANKEEYEKATAAGYPSWMGYALGGRVNGYADKTKTWDPESLFGQSAAENRTINQINMDPELLESVLQFLGENKVKSGSSVYTSIQKNLSPRNLGAQRKIGTHLEKMLDAGIFNSWKSSNTKLGGLAAAIEIPKFRKRGAKPLSFYDSSLKKTKAKGLPDGENWRLARDRSYLESMGLPSPEDYGSVRKEAVDFANMIADSAINRRPDDIITNNKQLRQRIIEGVGFNRQAGSKFVGDAAHAMQMGGRINGYATETTTWAKKAAAPKAYAGVLQGIPNWATKPAEYEAIVSALRAAGVPNSDKLAAHYIQDVLAHINPSTTNADGVYEKVWAAANLMKDSQVYNVFLETLKTRKDIGGLLNPSTVSRVAAASGLPMSLVQTELTKLADGVHPKTANGAKVMMTLARLFPSRTSYMPIAVAAGMGARLQGNFYDTLGQRALPSNLPTVTVRSYDPKGTGAPTSTTQGSRTASSGIVMPSGAIRPGIVMPNIQSIPSAAGGTGTSATVKVDGMGNVLSNGIDDMVANTITGQPIAVSSKELLAIGPNGGIAGVTSPGDEARGKIVHPMGTALMRGKNFQQKRLKGFAGGTAKGTTSGVDFVGDTPAKPAQQTQQEQVTEPGYDRPIAPGRMDKFAASIGFLTSGVYTLQTAFQQFTATTADGADKFTKIAAASTLVITSLQGVSQMLVDNGKIQAMQNKAAMMQGPGKGKMSMGMGKMLGVGSKALGMLGGPMGMIATSVAIAAVNKGIAMYQAAVKKAKAAGGAMFKDPIEGAKLLGITLKDTSAIAQTYSKIAEGLGMKGTGKGAYDKTYADVVKKDYGDLIDSLKIVLNQEEKRNKLLLTYINLTQKGFNAADAKDYVKEIARQSGSMSAFNSINLDNLKTSTEVANQVVSSTKVLMSSIGKVDQNLIGKYINKKTGAIYNTKEEADAARKQDSGFWQRSNMFEVKDSGQFLGDLGSNYTQIDANTAKELSAGALSSISSLGLDEKQMGEAIAGALKTAYSIAATDPSAANQAGAMILEHIANGTAEQQEAANASILEMMKEAGASNADLGYNFVLGGGLTEMANDVEEKFGGMGPKFSNAILSAIQSGNIDMVNEMLELSSGDPSPEVMQDFVNKIAKIQALAKIDLEVDIQLEQTKKQLEDIKTELGKTFDVLIASKQTEIDLENKRHEQAMKNLDRESERINDKKQLLQENTNYYLKELEREKQAEDYYANQRQTSLQGLSAISQGDVFGFIGAQMKAASDSDQFGRDRSIASIQETADDAQKKLDEELKGVEDRKAAESARHEAELANIQAEIEALNKKRAISVGDAEKAIAKIEKTIAMSPTDAGYQAAVQEAMSLATTAGMQASQVLQGVDTSKMTKEELDAFDKVKTDLGLAVSTFTADTETALQVVGRDVEEITKNIADSLGATGDILGEVVDTLNKPVDPNSVIAKIEKLAAINVGTAPGGVTGTTDPANAPVTPPSGGGGAPPTPKGAQAGVWYQDPSTMLWWKYGKNNKWQSTSGQPNKPIFADQGTVAFDKWTPMASGGMISGPGTGTSDSIFAMVSNGEYVIKADSAKSIGKAKLDKLNRDGLNGFAMGGLVGSMPSMQSAPGFSEGGGVGTMPKISAPSAPKYSIPSAGGGMDVQPIAQMARGGMMSGSASDNSSSYSFNFNGAGMDMVMSHVNKAVGGRISSNSRRIG